MRQSWRDPDGSWRTRARGRQVFSDPRINKGTAFDATERNALGLVGLMPPRILHLDEQASRSYAQFRAQPTDLARNIFLTGLHDRNEVLFFRLLVDHLPEMLPIVYTPTVGQAIERYSHEYRRPRGIYLTVDQPELVGEVARRLRPRLRRGRPPRRNRRRGDPGHRRLGSRRNGDLCRQAGGLHRRRRDRPEPGARRSSWTSGRTARAFSTIRCTSAPRIPVSPRTSTTASSTVT